MSKKDLYFAQAETLYVTEQKPTTAIARELKLAEKTVRNWRDEGEWDRKRQDYLMSKKGMYADLMELCRLITESALEDMKAKRKPSVGQLYALVPILGKILKVRDIEMELAPKSLKDNSDDKKELTKTVLDTIHSQLFGDASQKPPETPAEPAEAKAEENTRPEP